MKRAVTLTALSALFLAAPAIADDGHVSRSTLSSLGLGEMQILSDAEGMAVRGMSGKGASVWGASIVSAVLIDPNTKSFVAGTDTNLASSSSSGSHKHAALASQSNVSTVEFSLVVETATSSFSGFLFGGAGGSSHASGR